MNVHSFSLFYSKNKIDKTLKWLNLHFESFGKSLRNFPNIQARPLKNLSLFLGLNSLEKKIIKNWPANLPRNWKKKIADNLCMVSFAVSFAVSFFELSHSNKHTRTYITFKYFLDTQYRLLTFMYCFYVRYYLFCDKYTSKTGRLKRHYTGKDTTTPKTP